MDERSIEEFWQAHPCGDASVGGLDLRHRGDYEAFFRDYDTYRTRHEGHIAACLEELDLRDRRVLEIGLGQGAESERLIRLGARWSGLDLTQASVDRVRTRLALRELPFEALKQGSVLDIPYPDGAFDLAFSHGVLHHVPEILAAQREIARVLRPGGELVVMLYARWSLNYLVSISAMRRLGLMGIWLLAPGIGGIYGRHVENARRTGLWRYLRRDTFLSRNTDGPDNPYSAVYDRARLRRDFPDFELVRSYRRFLHAPPLPLHGLPFRDRLGRAVGWHLWAHLRRRDR